MTIKTQSILNFLKSAFWGLTAGFLILFFMPNSQLPVNWTKVSEMWRFYEKSSHNENKPKLTPIKMSFSDAVKKITPSVVSINVFRSQGVRYEEHLAPNEKILDVGVGFGSGIILDNRGFIVTNHHVIDKADTISVNFSDGTKRIVEVVGYDQKTDIAVLRTDKSNLTSAVIGNHLEAEKGDVVMAIGSPFGQNQSVSMGIISAITTHQFTQRIQTDAPINKGNSGGPLINSIGEVIGINQMTISSVGGGQTGINYAIPIERVIKIADDIILHGRVRRNWFGIHAIELREYEHEKFYPHIPFGSGFFINRIDPDSPASIAGLMSEDFITHIDGQAVSGVHDFYQLFYDTPIGKQIEVKIIRRNQRLTKSVKLFEMPENTSD